MIYLGHPAGMSGKQVSDFMDKQLRTALWALGVLFVVGLIIFSL